MYGLRFFISSICLVGGLYRVLDFILELPFNPMPVAWSIVSISLVVISIYYSGSWIGIIILCIATLLLHGRGYKNNTKKVAITN